MTARSPAPGSRIAFSTLASLSVLLMFCTRGPGERDGHGTAALNGTLAVAFGFDEGTGGTAADSSGNGNNGTMHGATWTTAGKYGDALAFSSGGYVEVPAGTNTNDLVPFTYCAWIYPLDMGQQNDGRIVHKGSDTARKQLQFDSSTTNGLGLYVDRSTSAASAISANGTVPLSQWSYACGTYSESDGPRLYLNGVEVSYASRSVGSGATTSDAAGALYVGNRATADKGFDGTIDEVRIHDSVLSPAMMQSDMNSAIQGGVDAGTDAGHDAGRDTGANADSGGGCDASAPSIRFLQVAAATPQPQVQTQSVPFSQAEGPGDLNVVVVAWNDASHGVTSVTDSNHNVYAVAVGPTVGASITQSLYYATAIAGGSNTVTVTFDAPVDSADIRILEYSGIAASAPVDRVSSATGSADLAATAQVTTTAPSELLVGAGTTSGLFSGPGAGFTSRIITQPDGDIAEDEVVSHAGTYSATAPQSGDWVMQLVTFKAATACASDGGTVSVSVSPRAAGVTLTQPQQFVATVQGSSNTQVTWAVDGASGGNTTLGTVSSAGLYTPPASAGLHTVTAKSVADTSKSASASVAVTSLAGVFTCHNDVARTGQDLQELGLTPVNVNQSQFGKVFSQPVDGFIYAQPLWVAGVAIDGKNHNVVYVATENNSVYAFDADTNQSTLWHVNLGIAVPAADTGDTTDLIPLLGITGTPVIDPTTNTLYVVAETKESGPSYHHRLHALDLATGGEKFAGPVDINPSVPGTGGNSSGGRVVYSPLNHFQRPALLLQKGVVYVAIGSSADTQPSISHGWIVGYGASSLVQVLAYSTSPNGEMASIWQGGSGVAADSSANMYVETGNGSFDANSGGTDFGDSALKLSTSGTVLDWFTPYNQDTLSSNDVDFGSAGPVVLPDQAGPVPHELLATGKPGILYLLNRDNMGHYQSSNNSQIVQSVAFGANTTNLTGGSYATVAYFNGNIYFADVGSPGDGKLKAYSLTNGLLSTSPTSESAVSFGYPGATPSVSANGSSNGIVWALQGQGYTPSTAPVLRAYDATNVASELYDSEQAGSRDRPGPAVKFVVPTVANAKVYVGTQDELTVFGLLP